MPVPAVLTKKRLCRQLRQNTGHLHRVIEEIVQQTIDLMAVQLAEGGRIEIENFLVLEVVTRQTAVPGSDETHTQHVLKVRPGRNLRDKLRQLTD